jgi:RNA polymerase sigma-70 factor (ECF subfamily)
MSEANVWRKSETPEMQAMRSQLGQMLEAAVDALPDTYRSVFVLREVEQLSTSETAECLELSEEAVKTRLDRARPAAARTRKPSWPSHRGGVFVPWTRCDRTVSRVLDRIRR